MEFSVEYIKDMYSSYMAIMPVEERDNRVDTYARKMLTENEIVGLLPCEIRTVDMKEKYYYNISSKQPVINVFEKGQIDEIQTSKLIGNIMSAIKEAKKYMLSEKGFVLAPEYVYMNISNFEIGLCYFPGYNKDIQEQLSVFLEFLLERVNHNNQRAIVMAYGLYKLLRENEVSFDNIEEFMNNTLSQGENDNCEAGAYVAKEHVENDEGDDLYEDEWYGEKEDKDELLFDSKKECKDYNLSDRQLVGIAAGIYALIMIGAYLLLGKVNEKVNMPLFLCIGFTTLCGIIAVVMLLKQNVLDKNKKEDREQSEDEKDTDYDEESYWQEEYMVTEDDKTVLLTDYNNSTGFALIGEDGERIRIKEFPFVIGKLKEKVSYCINDVTISRLHAKLDEYDGDVLLLTDLNSTNGTYVGDRQLKSNEVVKVNMQETITVGDHSFILIKEM